MSRKVFRLIFVFVLAVSVSMTAHAETLHGASDWQVVFTSSNKMDSNFKSTDLNDVIYGMQPGDNVIITLVLENQNSATTDWYMTNKVLSSLEDSSSAANGGAYTYILSYTGPNGEKKDLFSSDTVGGDTVSSAGEGLHEATDSLKDYFYLDTLSSGQKGNIILEVALDGETQGNSYQDTLADLQMNFAVELNDSESETPQTPQTTPQTSQTRTPTPVQTRSDRQTVTTVQTGDNSNPILYMVLCGVSGLLLLAFGCYSLRRRKRVRRVRKGGRR